jgi:putative membrane protein
MTGEPRDFDPRKIERPDPSLLRYYAVGACFSLFLFPLVFIPLWIRYETLRYRIDDEGVSMSWGILFKREILLTYRRIQDIHLRRNVLERWFGLATLSLQTASGSAGAEMTIVGVREAERLRDFLYLKMRGARDDGASDPAGSAGEAPPRDEALALLREIRDAMAAAGARQGSQT